MHLTVRALASGSSGNALLLIYQDADRRHVLLVDCGITLRMLDKRLECYGLKAGDIDAVVITHEHFDHVKSAYSFSKRHDKPIVANWGTLQKIYRGLPETKHKTLPTGAAMQMGTLTVQTFSVPHDAADPVGVNITAQDSTGTRHKVSYLTDVGCVTPCVRESTVGANLLILESNYDAYRLHSGPYPAGIKKRILSDRGHLSNEAAVELLTEHVIRTGPCALWLAHLSRVNNLPKLAMNYAQATIKLETNCPFVLDFAARDKPSASWSPGVVPLQLNLF